MNIRVNLLGFYYTLSGNNSLNCLSKLEKTQYLSLDEIEEMQFNKLKKLVNYSYNYVPFYKKTFRSLKLTPEDINSEDDLEKLPILTKDIINDNFNDLISVKYSKNNLFANSTGGSTGRNLKFFNDKLNADFRQAISMRGDRWAGLNLGFKHAYLWGSQLDASLQDNFLNKMYYFLQGALFLSSFELSDEKMDYYTHKLLKHNTKVLVAYPSSLYVYAKFLEKNNLSTNIGSIITSAETLYDYQRDFIESVFGCKIFNRYGCREFGHIACECEEHNGLHINMEHLNIEFLGLKDYETSDGMEKSNLIITDLDNYAMPFIRYEIGDIGSLINEKCECGRGLPLMNVEGRTFDVILGVNGNRLGGTFWTILLRTYVKGIEQFQVIQTARDELTVKLVKNEYFRQDSTFILEKKIREYCGNDMIINFKFVDEIEKPSSGKFRFIISNIDNS